MFAIQYRMIVLAIAWALDILLGDPHGIWHPVIGIGRLISYLDKRSKRRTFWSGVWLAFTVIVVSVGIPLGIVIVAYMAHPVVGVIVEGIMCYQLLAMRSLFDESMKVYYELRAGKVEEARHAVSMIVGRDTDALDEAGIAKAAVETVAENTSDGVVAPFMFMVLFGAAGGFFYKSINTMDSMIGYKNDKYRHLGTAAARLDDIVNFIPARVSAFLMVIASALCGHDAKNAWKIYKRDHSKHDSPNSAHTESVCAGALRVQLAGDAYYFGKKKEKSTIGDDLRPIEYNDIRRANMLMVVTSFLLFSICIGCLLLIYLINCL